MQGNLIPRSHGGSIFHPEEADSRNVLVALSLRGLSGLEPFLLSPAPPALSCGGR